MPSYDEWKSTEPPESVTEPSDDRDGREPEDPRTWSSLWDELERTRDLYRDMFGEELEGD